MQITKLKSVLAEKGMTSVTLAEKMGVTAQTISNWCRKQIPMHEIPNVSFALEIPMCDLVSGEIGKKATAE